MTEHSRQGASNGMTRYVLLSEFFPPQQGGIQTSLEVLAEALGSEVTVIAPGEYTPSGLPAGSQGYTKISRSLFSGRLRPSWLWLIPWLWKAKKEGMELAFFGHYSSAVLAAWFLSFFGLKYALFANGLDILGERKRTLGFLQPSVFRQADWIGVTSHFVGALVAKEGVPPSRIIRSHPMVVAPSRMDVRPIGKTLITVSRLVARKNVGRVLDALASIKDMPDIEYHVVGDGPEKDSLIQVAKSLGLSSRVHFHGSVSDDERDALLRQSNAFIMVPTFGQHSTDVEGLGQVYLQAAIAGLPMVGSNTGGVPDIIQHEKTGLLVNDPTSVEEISAAIRRVLTDETGRTSWVRAAQQLVQTEFTNQVRVDRMLMMFGKKSIAPDIAVVIPAFNSADTISATLTSLFQQTLLPKEVVVVDDGSTDDLAAALAPFNGKIKLISQSNQGAPVARNTGAAATSSPYLFFLDADTLLKPNALAEMAQALLTHPEVDFSYSNFIFGPKLFTLHNFSEKQLKAMNYIHTSSLLRRAAFPGFDPALKKFQDWDLWLTMAERGSRGIWLNKTLFRVRERKGGMSAWVPKIVYRLPFIGQGKGSDVIAKYRAAESVIRQKHHLS